MFTIRKLHCESESHLDYILPKIKQRLNNDPQVHKSETLKLKDIGLAHFFDTVTLGVFNKKKTSERYRNEALRAFSFAALSHFWRNEN